MKMTCGNAGEACAKALIDLDVEFVFTLTGGHLNHIHDELRKTDNSVQLVHARHEQAATFMATAFAQMKGKPGVAMLTAGPGFTNCISPLQQAAFNGTPLLLIAGSAGLEYRDKIDLQDSPQMAIAAPIVKDTFLCTQPSRVAEYVELAYRTASTGRPGPVYLELPCDVLAKSSPDNKYVYFKTIVQSRPVDRDAAKKTVDMLKEAKQPIVVVGSGGGYAKAGEALQELIEKASLPVFTCNTGRGIVSDLHPLSFGLAAPNRPLVAEKAYAEADLFIILGNRITLNHYFGGSYNRNAKLIQVDIEAEEIGRNLPIDLPVVSDIKAFVQEVTEQLDQQGLSNKLNFEPWIDTLRQEQVRCHEAMLPNMTSNEHPIHPQRLVYEVDSFLNRDDDVVLTDGGDTATWTQIGRTVRKPYRILDLGLFWCIGGGLADTLAARLVYPESRVALITGDGSFGFNFMEITTAVREQMKIVIIVSNDQSWGMIRHSQQLRLGYPIDDVTWLGPVPYHKMVEAAGGKGFFVDKADDIKPAIEAAFAANTVACVNVMTDPEVISPASIALGQLGAYKID